MSFRFKQTHTKYSNNINTSIRKEHGSFLAHHSKQLSHSKCERTSSFTSKGSLTMEAALAAPIFFFGIICLVYLMEMIAIQTTMKAALQDVGRNMAQEAYLNRMIFPTEMEQELIKVIGEERLNRSIVAGGSSGIDCGNSRTFLGTTIMELSVRYRLQIPVLMFHIPLIEREEQIRVKGWSGYEGGGFWNQGEDIVYVTETGVVYHKNPDCTYLELSIQSVRKEELEHMRNESGGKYYPCERCGNKKSQNVYITSTGNRYHSSVSCSGLKRSVYAVLLSEVYGRGGCSRCVK